MDVRVGVAEEPDLEGFHQRVDGVRGGEENGHGDERPAVIGYAVAELELREQGRRQRPGHERVHGGDGGRRHRDEGQHHRGERGRAARLPRAERAGEQDLLEREDEPDPPEVYRGRVRTQPATPALDARRPAAEALLEDAPAVADEEVAHVRAAPRRCAFGTANGLERDPLLAPSAADRNVLDGPAVAVARLEVHPHVRAGRIPAEDAFGLAHPLEEVLPVERLERPEAPHAARHGVVVHRRASGLAGGLADEAPCRAGELLDQVETQERRQRPELGHGERPDALELAHRLYQRLELDAVPRDAAHLPCEAPGHREAPLRTLGEGRETGLEGTWEILPDVPHRSLHDVVVVEEPLDAAAPGPVGRAVSREALVHRGQGGARSDEAVDEPPSPPDDGRGQRGTRQCLQPSGVGVVTRRGRPERRAARRRDGRHDAASVVRRIRAHPILVRLLTNRHGHILAREHGSAALPEEPAGDRAVPLVRIARAPVRGEDREVDVLVVREPQERRHEAPGDDQLRARADSLRDQPFHHPGEVLPRFFAVACGELLRHRAVPTGGDDAAWQLGGGHHVRDDDLRALAQRQRDRERNRGLRSRRAVEREQQALETPSAGWVVLAMRGENEDRRIRERNDALGRGAARPGVGPTPPVARQGEQVGAAFARCLEDLLPAGRPCTISTAGAIPCSSSCWRWSSR